MKNLNLNVSHVHTRTVDSARAALEAAAEWLADGYLVRAHESNDDPDNFDWDVHVYKLRSGA